MRRGWQSLAARMVASSQATWSGNTLGRFRCGVLRNPVMDLGLMIHVSDIPDWVYIEAWGHQGALPCACLMACFP